MKDLFMDPLLKKLILDKTSIYSKIEKEKTENEKKEKKIKNKNIEKRNARKKSKKDYFLDILNNKIDYKSTLHEFKRNLRIRSEIYRYKKEIRNFSFRIKRKFILNRRNFRKYKKNLTSFFKEKFSVKANMYPEELKNKEGKSLVKYTLKVMNKEILSTFFDLRKNYRRKITFFKYYFLSLLIEFLGI
jgi:hypothetical protein